MIIKKIITSALTALLFLPGLTIAQSSLSLGVTVNGSNWKGNNGAFNNRFESDKGGQFGLSISYSLDRFYTGLSLQGGDYQFDGPAPTQFTPIFTIPTSAVSLTHSDFDLLAGYYFWERVSLFVDLKAASSQWDNNQYKQSFGGLGLGVTAYHPLDNDWMLYGSWGVVGGTVKQTSGSIDLGDGTSNALVLAAQYTLSRNNNLNMGFKFRRFVFDFDNGAEQRYSLNGLFIGYNHVFEF